MESPYKWHLFHIWREFPGQREVLLGVSYPSSLLPTTKSTWRFNSLHCLNQFWSWGGTPWTTLAQKRVEENQRKSPWLLVRFRYLQPNSDQLDLVLGSVLKSFSNMCTICIPPETRLCLHLANLPARIDSCPKF